MKWFKNLFKKKKKVNPEIAALARDEKGRWIIEATKTTPRLAVLPEEALKHPAGKGSPKNQCGCGGDCKCSSKTSTSAKKPVAKKTTPAKQAVAEPAKKPAPKKPTTKK
jgi:hypothetical protein